MNQALEIIYEDADMLVVNKPAGLIVNKSDTTNNVETLQGWIESKFPISNFKFPARNATHSVAGGQISNKNNQHSRGEDTPEENINTSGVNQVRQNSIINNKSSIINIYPSSEETFYQRAGIVHRLDKETSGIILVAKNPQSFVSLQKQFADRIVKKIYLALVHGEILPELGEINVPVGRLKYNRMHFGVVAGGREAVTHYKVAQKYELRIKNYADFQHPQGEDNAVRYSNTSGVREKNNGEKLTLVELYPQTGRTHQIRVHLQYIGHPIFADELYAGRKTARNDRKLLPRLFLHASKITFLHPTTKKEMRFTAELPEELEHFLNKLQQK